MLFCLCNFFSSCTDKNDKVIDEMIQNSEIVAKLPINTDEVTTWVEVKREGKYIVFGYEVNENVVDVNTLKNKIQNLNISDVVSAVNSDPLGIKGKELGYGMIFRYVTSRTHEIVDAKIENKDL